MEVRLMMAVEIEIDEGVQNEEEKDEGEVDGRVEVENEEDGCRVHVENANEEDVDKDDVNSCSDSIGDSVATGIATGWRTKKQNVWKRDLESPP